jgi:hypothetical protein
METRFARNENGEASAKQIETYQRTTNTLRRVLEALASGLARRPREINALDDEVIDIYRAELEATP